MNDADLIADFIRTVPAADCGTVVEVCVISWPHPHEPKSTWSVAAELPPGALQEEVDQAVAKVLRDRKYFAVCRECGGRKPVGWMHGGGICQRCAEEKHGVVY